MLQPKRSRDCSAAEQEKHQRGRTHRKFKKKKAAAKLFACNKRRNLQPERKKDKIQSAEVTYIARFMYNL